MDSIVDIQTRSHAYCIGCKTTYRDNDVSVIHWGRVERRDGGVARSNLVCRQSLHYKLDVCGTDRIKTLNSIFLWGETRFFWSCGDFGSVCSRYIFFVKKNLQFYYNIHLNGFDFIRHILSRKISDLNFALILIFIFMPYIFRRSFYSVTTLYRYIC